MEYTMIEIYNQEYKKDKDLYNFIIKEKWSNARKKPKFYEITKNGESILYTSLWQTWKAKIKKIRGE